MAVDSPEFIDSALKVYNAEVHKAIQAQEERLAQLSNAHDQLKQTVDMVAELPSKLRHQCMVPLGRHAFFPGQLTRTNELVVHLGDQYYVETTAQAASGILQRRLDILAEGVSKAQQQLQALQARLTVTQSILKDDSRGTEEPMEIRSTLEESDALLASAKASKAKAKAAAAAAARHQPQGPVSRVKAPSGYSYTPLGLAETQGTEQQEPDPADAALQARLEELIRLEEEQGELQEQQQQQQQPPLGTIQEGDEEDDTEASSASEISAAAAAGGSRLNVVQQLQQLEAEPDSDDEEQHQHQQRQRQRQQQQQGKAVPPAAAEVGQAALANLEGQGAEQANPPQQQQQQQKSVTWAGTAAPSSSSSSSTGPKSALKKGFLTASPAKTSSSRRSSGGPVKSSAASSSSSSIRARQSAAFTGAVVERASPTVDSSTAAAAVPVVSPIGAVVERSSGGAEALAAPAAAPGSAPAPTSDSGGSSTSRISKFKLRRMGLEPDY